MRQVADADERKSARLVATSLRNVVVCCIIAAFEAPTSLWAILELLCARVSACVLVYMCVFVCAICLCWPAV